MPARAITVRTDKNKSLESWIWDAGCSIRGAKDAPKYWGFILPLIFKQRLCDVFGAEPNRIAAGVGSRKKEFQLAANDHKLVRFCLPLKPANPENSIWSVIRNYLITQQPQMDWLASRGMQKNINIQFLQPWPFPLPSLETQKKIAEAFTATDQKSRQANQKRNEIQTSSTPSCTN